jgi:hypothetical protein
MSRAHYSTLLYSFPTLVKAYSEYAFTHLHEIKIIMRAWSTVERAEKGIFAKYTT